MSQTAERLLDQPQVPGHQPDSLPDLDVLDRQFPELGGVFLIRYLEQLLPLTSFS